MPRRDPAQGDPASGSSTAPTAPRRLSVFSYARLVLGGLPAETAAAVETCGRPARARCWPATPQRGEFSDGVAFAAAVAPAGARRAPQRRPHGLHRPQRQPGAAGGAARRRRPGRPRRGRARPLLRAPGRARAGAGRDQGARVPARRGRRAARDARRCSERYASLGRARAGASSEISAFWRDLVTPLELRTPACRRST